MVIKCERTSNGTLKQSFAPDINPELKWNDDVVVYVEESIEHQVVRTEANLCHKIIIE